MVFTSKPECPLNYHDIIVYSAIVYQNGYKVKPSIRGLAKLTGFGRHAVTNALFHLKDRGIYDGDALLPPDGWFMKIGARPFHFAYFKFYPPSDASPLNLNQHIIFSMIVNLDKQRKMINYSYVAKLMKMDRHVVTAHCKKLEKLELIDNKLKPRPLSESQIQWFLSREEMHTKVIESAEEAEAEAVRISREEPTVLRSPVAKLILESGIKTIKSLNLHGDDELISAYAPLASKGIWFDDINASPSLFRRKWGDDIYRVKMIECCQKLWNETL